MRYWNEKKSRFDTFERTNLSYKGCQIWADTGLEDNEIIAVSQETIVMREAMPSDNVDKCGIKGIVTWTPEGFKAACKIHDLEFIKNEQGTQTKTRKQVDDELLVRLLAASDTKLKRIGAYVYYGISRVFGGWFW